MPNLNAINSGLLPLSTATYTNVTGCTVMYTCAPAGNKLDKYWKISIPNATSNSRVFHLFGDIGTLNALSGSGCKKVSTTNPTYSLDLTSGASSFCTVTGFSWQHVQLDSGSFGFPTQQVWALTETISRTGNQSYTATTTSNPVDCSDQFSASVGTTSTFTDSCNIQSADLAATLKGWDTGYGGSFNNGEFQPHYFKSTDCNPGGPGVGHCRIAVYMTDAEMEAALIHSGSFQSTAAADYTNTQSNAALPNTTTLANARTWLDGQPVGVQYAYDCALDPTNWTCPASDGTGGGLGGTGNWTMPDCRTLTYTACSTLITQAGYAGTFSNIVRTPANQDTTLKPGAVISTNPPAGTTLTSTYAGPVTIDSNPVQLAIRLPKPGVNETCTNYRTRIKSLTTYDLSVTCVQADADVSGIGPLAVNFIKVPIMTGGDYDGTGCFVVVPTGEPNGEIQLDPLHWPSNLDCTQINPLSSVTLLYNSADATVGPCNPAVDPNCGGGGGGGGGGGSSCDGYLTATPDFGPLQNHDLSNKFPFSAFAYIGDWMNGLTGDGVVAPTLNFSILYHGSHPLVLDFSVLDGAMPSIRGVFIISATIGLLWALATAIMGLGSLGGGGSSDDE